MLPNVECLYTKPSYTANKSQLASKWLFPTSQRNASHTQGDARRELEDVVVVRRVPDGRVAARVVDAGQVDEGREVVGCELKRKKLKVWPLVKNGCCQPNIICKLVKFGVSSTMI